MSTEKDLKEGARIKRLYTPVMAKFRKVLLQLSREGFEQTVFPAEKQEGESVAVTAASQRV